MSKLPSKKPVITRKPVKTKTTEPINPRQKQNMPLIEYIMEALLANREPMHVSKITEKITEMGWIPVGKKPSHVVYTTIHGVLQRKGDESGIKLLGGGYFSTEKQAEREGYEVREVKPPANVVIDVNGKKVKVRASEIPEDRRFCGNCKSLEYLGPQELHMKRGVCNNDDRSGRSICRRTARACPHWEFRGNDKIRADRERNEILKLTVLTFNLSAARVRGELSPRDRYIEE